MRKIMMVFAFLLAVTGTDAQTYKFKTTAFAYKTLGSYGWSRWTDWERTSMLVVINADRDVITVYSQDPQEYDIVDYQGEETDSNGKSIRYLCVLRKQYDGSIQLYVDFNNIMWVYSLTDR